MERTSGSHLPLGKKRQRATPLPKWKPFPAPTSRVERMTEEEDPQWGNGKHGGLWMARGHPARVEALAFPPAGLGVLRDPRPAPLCAGCARGREQPL